MISMPAHGLLSRACLVVWLAATIAPGVTSAADSVRYPPAARENTVDNYHGVRVADPYRWLENPDAPRSRRWIQQENELTNSYLASAPNSAATHSRLTTLANVVTYPSGTIDGAAIVNRGGHYFFVRRDPGRAQPVLYWMAARDSEPKALLDPNTQSKNGTAALLSWAVSNDGRLLAYGIARAGSDWQDIYFREVDTGADRADKLEWSKFSNPEWSGDGTGVYYGRYPEPPKNELLTGANFNQQLCFHRLGTAQASDKIVYQRPDHKEWVFGARVSDDGRFLIIDVQEGTRPENLLFYRDLTAPGGKIVQLVGEFKAQYQFIGNRGSQFYLLTTDGAPKGRVITWDVAHSYAPAPIVTETANTLEQAVLSGASLYLVYEKDVASLVIQCAPDGTGKREISLPGKGTVQWAAHLAQPAEQFFAFASFTQPRTLYSFNTQSSQVAPFEKSTLPFDPRDFETRQVFYPSKDGTRIPMFVVGRKGFQASPETPCLLWGYGGFDISNEPAYQPLTLAWIEQGGIFASANMRGGGEYGEAWHQAGMKAHKQNVFDDFVAGAEWLTANKYTSRDKLAIFGWSNGGLLIGAVLNQHPELFGAAVAGAGVMDMLRFQKFTIGNAWTSEYGSPDNAADFAVLRAYSPLHNVRQGADYPPTLILTADHDDRVVPAHSFKYAAALQYAQGGRAPILIRIDTQAGHGSGKPVTKQVEDWTVILSFLEKALGMGSAPA